MSYFFFLYLLPLRLYAQILTLSSNIDEVFSINPSANVFVFENFNIDYKDWLTFSGGTDRLGEFCYNVSVWNDLNQMVIFFTCIPVSDSHILTLLDLFLSSDASICSTMAFPPLTNSDHVVSVSIEFSWNSKQDVPFHGIAYAYFRLDWNCLPCHWRNVPWSLSLLLLLLLVNFVIRFRLKLMYTSFVVSITSTLTHIHGF